MPPCATRSEVATVWVCAVAWRSATSAEGVELVEDPGASELVEPELRDIGRVEWRRPRWVSRTRHRTGGSPPENRADS